jgi:plastocyanin
MALRRRQRGLAPAAMAALAILLAACGASSTISASPETPTPGIEPNACDLLSDATVATALAPAAGAATPTAGAVLTHLYSVEKISEGGAKTAGQCIWTDTTSAAKVIALVIPGAQLAKIADYVTGATKLGDAYIQEGSTRGFVSVQDGPDVIAITLLLDVDASVRDARLADLARVASGAAIPSISAAPSSAAATATGATASGPGEKVQGQTAAATVKESDQLQFSPTSVSIKAGDVLEWDNTGQIAHNVTFDDYQSITSDTMNGGDTYQVKFTQPGTYQFHCTFHPGMNGTVTVQ